MHTHGRWFQNHRSISMESKSSIVQRQVIDEYMLTACQSCWMQHSLLLQPWKQYLPWHPANTISTQYQISCNQQRLHTFLFTPPLSTHVESSNFWRVWYLDLTSFHPILKLFTAWQIFDVLNNLNKTRAQFLDIPLWGYNSCLRPKPYHK